MGEEKLKCKIWSQNPTGYFPQCALNLKEQLLGNLFSLFPSALSPVFGSIISDYTVSFNLFISDLSQLLAISLLKPEQQAWDIGHHYIIAEVTEIICPSTDLENYRWIP